MVRARNDVEELERRIGYRFRDSALRGLALTHSSFHEGGDGDDNGRLAFLGDAVLELAIRKQGYQTAKLAKRGDLSVEADRLVRNSRVAERARALGIGLWLHVGKGESANAVGEDRRLAEAFEALAGAIYLEAGQPAFQVVTRLMDGDSAAP